MILQQINKNLGIYDEEKKWWVRVITMTNFSMVSLNFFENSAVQFPILTLPLFSLPNNLLQ